MPSSAGPVSALTGSTRRRRRTSAQRPRAAVLPRGALASATTRAESVASGSLYPRRGLHIGLPDPRLRVVWVFRTCSTRSATSSPLFGRNLRTKSFDTERFNEPCRADFTKLFADHYASVADYWAHKRRDPDSHAGAMVTLRGWAPVIVGVCGVLTCNPVVAIPVLTIARERGRNRPTLCSNDSCAGLEQLGRTSYAFSRLDDEGRDR